MNLHASEDIDVFTTIGDSHLQLNENHVPAPATTPRQQEEPIGMADMDVDDVLRLGDELKRRLEMGTFDDWDRDDDAVTKPEKLRRGFDVDDLLTMSGSRKAIINAAAAHDDNESIKDEKKEQTIKFKESDPALSPTSPTAPFKRRKSGVPLAPRPVSASFATTFSIRPFGRGSIGPMTAPMIPTGATGLSAERPIHSPPGCPPQRQQNTGGNRRLSLQDFVLSRRRSSAHAGPDYLFVADPKITTQWYEDHGLWLMSGTSLSQDIDQVIEASNELLGQLGADGARKAMRLPGEDPGAEKRKKVKDVDEFLAFSEKEEAEGSLSSSAEDVKKVEVNLLWEAAAPSNKPEEYYVPWTEAGTRAPDIEQVVEIGLTLSGSNIDLLCPEALREKEEAKMNAKKADIEYIMSLADSQDAAQQKGAADHSDTSKSDLQARYLALLASKSRKQTSRSSLDKVSASTPNLPTWRPSDVVPPAAVTAGSSPKRGTGFLGAYFHSTGMLAAETHYGQPHQHHHNHQVPREYDIDDLLNMGATVKKGSRKLSNKAPAVKIDAPNQENSKSSSSPQKENMVSTSSLDVSELMEIGVKGSIVGSLQDFSSSSSSPSNGASRRQSTMMQASPVNRDRLKSTTGTFHSARTNMTRLSGRNGSLFASMPAKLDQMGRRPSGVNNDDFDDINNTEAHDGGVVVGSSSFNADEKKGVGTSTQHISEPRQSIQRGRMSMDSNNGMKKRRMTAPEIRHYVPVFFKGSHDIDDILSVGSHDKVPSGLVA
ncbi:hypothetical protein HDV05_003505 [Chytridiales sp. JEL 0842]|nr:hypothetical protein HDV05_003505 [Chytridiales sp. JEL 0842]